MEAATLYSATDPATGIVNMDIITTGRSTAMKMREEEVVARLKAVLIANKSAYRKGSTFEKL